MIAAESSQTHTWTHQHLLYVAAMLPRPPTEEEKEASAYSLNEALQPQHSHQVPTEQGG